MSTFRDKPWWFFLILEALGLGIVAGIMHSSDAPSWALILVVYVATRSSRVDLDRGLGCVQSAVHVNREEIQRVEERIDAATRLDVLPNAGVEIPHRDFSIDGEAGQ